MCVILAEVRQFAFTQASFLSLSDVHECSGGLKMDLVRLDGQPLQHQVGHVHQWGTQVYKNAKVL